MYIYWFLPLEHSHLCLHTQWDRLSCTFSTIQMWKINPWNCGIANLVWNNIQNKTKKYQNWHELAHNDERKIIIMWSDAGILLIRNLETNFSEILTWIQTFSFKEMQLKMSSAKRHTRVKRTGLFITWPSVINHLFIHEAPLINYWYMTYWWQILYGMWICTI